MADLDEEFLRFQAELSSVEDALGSHDQAEEPQPAVVASTTEPVAGGHHAETAAHRGAHGQVTASTAAAAPALPPQVNTHHMAHHTGQQMTPQDSHPMGQHTGHQVMPQSFFAGGSMPPHQHHMIPPPPAGVNGMPSQMFAMRPPMGFLPPPMSLPPVAAMHMAPPTLVPVSYTPAGVGGQQSAYGGYNNMSNASTSGMGGMAASASAAPATAAAAIPGPPLTDAQKAKAAKIEEKKKKGVLREAAGERWRDPTLMEWPENDYRIFVGDLGTEVSDELLARAFKQYSSFAKAKIVRDKRTNKSKGFGFVSFLDSADFAKALREMNGKYVGNRPCKLSKSTWDDRAGTFKRKDGSLGGGPKHNKKHKS